MQKRNLLFFIKRAIMCKIEFAYLLFWKLVFRKQWTTHLETGNTTNLQQVLKITIKQFQILIFTRKWDLKCPVITEMFIPKVLFFTTFFASWNLTPTREDSAYCTCLGRPSCLQSRLCPRSQFIFLELHHTVRESLSYLYSWTSQKSSENHQTANHSKIIKKDHVIKMHIHTSTH